ncbi:hypothetical protein [Actinomadura fibrosa]|uniref:Uncharacterized protein n=1 Tax=Actinomadura fibrosa TaxID=111802 RepID=A0ABW2XVJ2_9ACTN|nr:hypothetical protein [Actinomadura fibrosa]
MPAPYLTGVSWSGTALRVTGRIERNGTVPPAPDIELHLRERDGGGLLRVPADRTVGDGTAGNGTVGFEARIDVEDAGDGCPLPGGLWDVDIAIGGPAEDIVMPLGPRRAPDLDDEPQRRFLPDSTTVAVYFNAQGALAIDVGGRPHVAGATVADRLGWNEQDEEVVVTGRIDYERLTMPVSGMLDLVERHTRRTYEVIAMLEECPGGLRYTAEVPVTRALIDDPLPRGTWDAQLCLGFSGMHRVLRLLAPADPVDVQVRRRLRHLRVVSSTAPDPLTITVGRA